MQSSVVFDESTIVLAFARLEIVPSNRDAQSSYFLTLQAHPTKLRPTKVLNDSKLLIMLASLSDKLNSETIGFQKNTVADVIAASASKAFSKPFMVIIQCPDRYDLRIVSEYGV